MRSASGYSALAIGAAAVAAAGAVLSFVLSQFLLSTLDDAWAVVVISALEGFFSIGWILLMTVVTILVVVSPLIAALSFLLLLGPRWRTAPLLLTGSAIALSVCALVVSGRSIFSPPDSTSPSPGQLAALAPVVLIVAAVLTAICARSAAHGAGLVPQRLGVGVGIVVLALAAISNSASAGLSVERFRLPAAQHPGLADLTLGPDGAFWFAQTGDLKIGRISTKGEVTEFQIRSGTPQSLEVGRDGLWFALGRSKIAHIDTQGHITEFDLPAVTVVPNFSAVPDSLVEGADGSLWYRVRGASAVGRIAPGGSAALPFIGDIGLTPRPDVSRLVRGSAGGIWFVLGNPIALIHIDDRGRVQRHVMLGLANVQEVIAGDGATLWFTQEAGVGHVTLGETPTVVQISLPNDLRYLSRPTLGPDGSLWVAAQQGGTFSSAQVPKFLLNFDQTRLVERLELPGPSNIVTSIAIGPDGRPWFLPYPDSFLGRVASDGKVTLVRFEAPAAPHMSDLSVGPDAALWFIDNNNSSPYYVYRFKP